MIEFVEKLLGRSKRPEKLSGKERAYIADVVAGKKDINGEPYNTVSANGELTADQMNYFKGNVMLPIAEVQIT